MKRYTLLYYIAALFSLTTISCSDENSLSEDYVPSGHYLYVSPTSLTFTSSAASKTVAVTTNISYTVSSSATWCTVTPSTDGKTLTIAVTENTGDDSRSATVTLKHSDSELTAQVNITQSGSGTFTVTGNGMTVTFKMIKVEAGTFQMGSTSGYSNEKPVHQVTLTKDYYIGETEVTQALWYAVMGQSPTSDGDKWNFSYGLGDNYPAYYISYNDITSFLTKLNTLVASQLPSGMKFRFPTEAEWEYAAKGGNKSKGYTYSGSDNIGDVAWYYANSNSSTHPVKTKAANELGIYDMSGNVFEWCYDWYGDYSSSAQTDPTGATSGSDRVLRSSCWGHFATSCRSACRNGLTPTSRYYNDGVRLAL